MSALTTDKIDGRERKGTLFEYPQATSTEIFAGALVFLNANGYAQPATAAQGLVCAGLAQGYSLNDGANGAVSVLVKHGVFAFEVQDGDAPTIANIGDPCYAYDDQTVGLTQGLRSLVGTVVDIDVDGRAFVAVGAVHGQDANKKLVLTMQDVDLDDEAATRTFYLPVPVAGKITDIRTTVNGATTAGADAVLTWSVNDDAITGGVVTIAASSAATTIDSAQPTAANDVALGDNLKLVITGAQTADSYANIAVTISY